MKAFQAHASGGFSVTRPTARQAAVAFFEQFPNKRKCDVIAGTTDGRFFTIQVQLCKRSGGPKRWTDVTQKTAHDLPNDVEAESSPQGDVAVAT